MHLRYALCLFLLLLLKCTPVCAGPALDEILNPITLGEHTDARDEARFATVEPGKAVGQTFTTGDNVEKVFRIALWQAAWNEAWQPDESLVMTLWDSPAKHTSCGRCAIPYDRRSWEGAVPMFTLDARVQPRHAYYFELTVEIAPLRPAVTPREWLLAHKRPGITNGDGKIEGIGIARDKTADGHAYLAGQAQDYDLWFQVHERRAFDRDAAYGRAFAHFDLNYAPLAAVRGAVQARNWDGAAQALVRHFESRADLIDPVRRKPQYNPQFETHDADLVVEHKVPLDDGMTLDLGPTWNHYALWPERGGVGLTRSGIRKYLAAAYAATGNEKYARAWNDMLANFFVQAPSPILAGVYKPDEAVPASLPPGLAGGSLWSGLSLGARMTHGFAYYTPFADSPYFTTDLRAAFIINLGEMGDVLEHQKGGGNWETQMANGLFEFGLEFPEFAKSKQWVSTGFKTLIANALSTVRPDGVLHEPTINYHQLVMGRYAATIAQARQLGLTVPDEMARLTEKMYDFVMYSALPDGTLPLWGDANPISKADSLEAGVKLFKRDDFAYVADRATGAAAPRGAPPRQTSVGFPDGGFYYMRTGWQPDAHYMGVHAGPFGSHGHSDALGLVAAVYGKPVLLDPGVYTYGTPEAQELGATRSHNTITVDNRDARSGQSDAWVTAEHFDFLAAHNEGYSGLRDVVQQRRIWFLKPLGNHPALWLVFDDITGPGEHAAQLRYRFAALPVQADADTLQAWTADPTHNLMVRVLEQGATKLELTTGISAGSWEKLIQVPLTVYQQQGKLPLSFTTLLLPFDGAMPPACTTQLLPVAGALTDGARAVWAEQGNEAVLAVVNTPAALHEQPQPLTMSLPDKRRVAMDAAAAVLRFSRVGAQWQPLQVEAVRARSITLDGKPLWNAAALTDKVDVALPQR